MNGNINSITLLGRLGDDPEIINDEKHPRVKLRLAYSEAKKVGDKWETETEWHSCVVFGKYTTTIAKDMRKGDRVMVIGKLTVQRWKDRDGIEHKQHEIVSNEIHHLPERKRDADKGEKR